MDNVNVIVQTQEGVMDLPMGGDLAPSLGGETETHFADQILERSFLRKDISILLPKISATFFLVVDSLLSVFCLSLLAEILRPLSKVFLTKNLDFRKNPP